MTSLSDSFDFSTEPNHASKVPTAFMFDRQVLAVSSELDVSIAGIAVRLDAPKNVVDVLRATLASVPISRSVVPEIAIAAQLTESAWEIGGPAGARKMLDPRSMASQVAGAIVTSAIAEVANLRALRSIRATIVERDGRALAMIGADWESTVTIAAHLHTRGWRYVSGDHGLRDPATNETIGFEKALYVTSSSIAHLPVNYRIAIEASPWCVTRHGIAFYAVDPAKAISGERPWTPTASLRAVLLVDGRADALPALETPGQGNVMDERFDLFGVGAADHGIAELTVGSYVPTCDLVERWFESLAS